MRRLLLLAGLLVCAGCLRYEITITTRVLDDGSFMREITIEEKTKAHKVWRRFQPSKAYKRVGTDENGYTMTAKFPAGEHPGGLRIVIQEGPEKYAGLATTAGLDAAENTVRVEVEDLMIGKLYTYIETMHTGVDELRFRNDLRRYLELGLRVFMKGLAIQYPDVDFTKVEKNAREILLPRVHASLLTLYEGGGVLMRDYRAHPFADDSQVLLKHPKARVVLAELARYGVERKPDAPLGKTMDDFLKGDAWLRGEKFVEEFLAPLGNPAKEAEIKAAIYTGGPLSKAMDKATDAIFPGEQDQKQLRAELSRFVVSALGGYASLGFLDKFDIKARVTMPGVLLRTNGELVDGPRWELEQADLIVVQPKLTAYSFAPAKGVRGDFTLASLMKVREAIRKLSPEHKRELDEAVYGRRRMGEWDKETGARREVQSAYEKIRKAVLAAKR